MTTNNPDNVEPTTKCATCLCPVEVRDGQWVHVGPSAQASAGHKAIPTTVWEKKSPGKT